MQITKEEYDELVTRVQHFRDLIQITAYFLDTVAALLHTGGSKQKQEAVTLLREYAAEMRSNL